MKAILFIILLIQSTGCYDEPILPIDSDPLITFTEDSKSLSIDIHSTSESILMITSAKISVDTFIITQHYYSCFDLKKEKWARVLTFIDKDRQFTLIPSLIKP